MTNTLTLRFIYDGKVRHVDNVEVEPRTRTIIGFEMRKSGKWSYKVKRYSYDKINDLEVIRPFRRVGPRVGRPS